MRGIGNAGEGPICVTCGTLFPPGKKAPEACPICQDERQYVRAGGQAWTALAQMRRAGYKNAFYTLEEGLVGIRTVPKFAIGQQMLLVRTEEGNLLWDAISFVDDLTVELLSALGGVRAIAVSHPHFYASMAVLAERLGAPIYIPEVDLRWVAGPEAGVRPFSQQALPLFGGLTILRLGGHFPGACALHWAGGRGGEGALLTGDTVTVTADHRWVSFMKSFPNYIPLDAGTVRTIGARLEPWAFDRIYGGWPDSVVEEGAKAVVARSVERYIAAVSGPSPQDARDNKGAFGTGREMLP